MNLKYAFAIAAGALLGTTACSTSPYQTQYYNGYTVYYSGCPYGWGACYYNGGTYYYYSSSYGSSSSYGTGNGSGNGAGSSTTGNGSGNGSGSSSTGNGSGSSSTGNGSGSSTGNGSGSSSTGNGSGSSTGNGSGSSTSGNSSGGSTGNGTGNGSGSSFTVEGALAQSTGFKLPDGKGGVVNCDGNQCADSVTGLPGIESSTDGNTLGSSVGSDSHDTDLQRAEAQQQILTDRAQNIADQFQMGYDKALELTKLADKVQSMTVQGQMTLADRNAVVNSAMGMAGVNTAEVNAAMQSVAQDGNQKALNALMDKAAANLGMSSSAGLRDQILPSLGIQL